MIKALNNKTTRLYTFQLLSMLILSLAFLKIFKRLPDEQQNLFTFYKNNGAKEIVYITCKFLQCCFFSKFTII